MPGWVVWTEIGQFRQIETALSPEPMPTVPCNTSIDKNLERSVLNT